MISSFTHYIHLAVHKQSEDDISGILLATIIQVGTADLFDDAGSDILSTYIIPLCTDVGVIHPSALLMEMK